jgi:hypothetical protein
MSKIGWSTSETDETQITHRVGRFAFGAGNLAPVPLSSAHADLILCFQQKPHMRSKSSCLPALHCTITDWTNPAASRKKIFHFVIFMLQSKRAR